jgi:antitoxin CcdA
MRMKTARKNSKRPVNVMIEESLLAEAKSRKLNISHVLDKALREDIAKRWLKDNAEAFEENRKRIEEEGMWSDGLRTW